MKKKQKNKPRMVSLKQFVIFNAILVSVLFACLYALFTFTAVRTADWDNPRQVKQFLTDTVDTLSVEAPLTPQNDYQYIPELDLQFDLDRETRLAYTYHPAHEDGPELALVTSTHIKEFSKGDVLNQQTVEDVFSNIEAFQNCQQIFIVLKGDLMSHYGDDYKQVASVPLDDGQLYIWEYKGNLCREGLKDSEAVKRLRDILMTAESV